MISLDYLKGHGITSSLLFIKADTINIFVNINYVGEKKYRAIFKYNGIEYDLPITDPIIRDEYESYQPGSYQLKDKDIYLCLSIGEPFQPPGSESYFCYKLVAAIIRVNK